MSSEIKENKSSFFLRSKSKCLRHAADIISTFNHQKTNCLYPFKTTISKVQKEIPSQCPLDKKGSITLEAALILPVFIFAMSALLFYFQLMLLQQNIAQGLNSASWQGACVYHLENVLPDVFDGSVTDCEDEISQRLMGFAGDFLATGITSLYVRSVVVDCVGEEYLDSSCIKNGAEGLFCYGYVDGAMLKAGASYEVCIPFMPSGIFSFKMTQQVTRRIWIGITDENEETASEKNGEGDEEDEEKTIVYVTKYGTVYHLFKDCRSLKRSIQTVTYASVGNRTNSEGAHYYPCEICVHGGANAIVFITLDGNRYHNSCGCGSLLRYIQEIDMAKTGEKTLCSFCRRRQEEENEPDK